MPKSVHRFGNGWRGVWQKPADGKPWPMAGCADAQLLAGFFEQGGVPLRASRHIPYIGPRSFT